MTSTGWRPSASTSARRTSLAFEEAGPVGVRPLPFAPLSSTAMTIETAVPAERAYLVALEMQGARFEADDSLEELATLVQAAGGKVVGRTLQRRGKPDPNTFVGKGKAATLAVEAKRLAVDPGECDEELTTRQQGG